MKKRSLSLMSVIVILIVLSVIWIMFERTNSNSEPQEALFAMDNDLLLIPGYKINDEALFFFINDTDNLGATYVKKGFFDWKAGMTTWSPMDKERNYDKLIGYQVHGENLIYGLIRHGDERLIQIGEHNATILNLAMLPPSDIAKFQLEGLYIWYIESETSLNKDEIKLLNKNTGEEIDSIEIQ